MSTLGKGRGRKPVDIAAQQRYGNQDQIWQVIRELEPPFNLSDIACRLVKHDAVVNDSTIKSYLVRLVRGGYLEQLEGTPYKGCCQRHNYRLINDCGREAPRLKKNGQPTRQGLGNEQMWRSMKIIGTFTPSQLSVAASTAEVPVKKTSAKAYIKHLLNAGYLAVKRPGKPGTETSYVLLASKNTGPKPPQVQRTKRIFDPNLGAVVWQEESDHD